MKHRFRKYLGNRGSALFMVLSTMTALMVLVMAMYFSVVSSRAVQYKVFNQEQAYRSAISISDTIYASLGSGGALSTKQTGQPGVSQSVLDAMLGLQNVGDSISTGTVDPVTGANDGANGFLAFNDGNLTYVEDQNQIGAYTVTITKCEPEGKALIYDIAVTTSVNGVIETTHSYMSIVLNTAEPPNTNMNNIFTSTGYVPNDVYLDGGEFLTDVFFDNENAIIGAYHSMQLKIGGNVTAGGSLDLQYIDGVPCDEPVTWAIRNRFSYNAAQTLDLGYGSDKGRILVGGDMWLNGSGMPKNCDVYVLGDLHINSTSGTTNVTFHVDGDIIVDKAGLYLGSVGHVIYQTDSPNNTVTLKEQWDSFTPLKWDLTDTTYMTPTEFMTELETLTATIPYYKWELNDARETESDYIKELNKSASGYKETKINFNIGQTDIVVDGYTVPAGTYTQYLEWNPKTIPGYYANGDSLTYTAVVIEDVTNEFTGDIGSVNDLALVIDTGDDPMNQYIIRVQPNRDYLPDVNNDLDSFSWYPHQDHNSSIDMSIIVRGKGSVVVDIPDGCAYQDMDNVLFMHETWFVLLGGKYTPNASNPNGAVYESSGILSGTTAAKTASFIHSCTESCTDCNYQVGYSTQECTTPDCNKAKLRLIRCEEHEYEYTYCETCQSGSEPKKTNSGKYYGLCANRVDRKAVDAAVASLTGNEKSLIEYTDDEGNTVFDYPTTNIFLVSCDESADIRLSQRLDGVGIMQNGFFGFIYAPYMTFKAYGNNQGGGYVRFCGGMIVSDYILEDSMSFLTCYPEQLPTDLMSANNRLKALQGQSTKSWKIKLICH